MKALCAAQGIIRRSVSAAIAPLAPVGPLAAAHCQDDGTVAWKRYTHRAPTCGHLPLSSNHPLPAALRFNQRHGLMGATQSPVSFMITPELAPHLRKDMLHVRALMSINVQLPIPQICNVLHYSAAEKCDRTLTLNPVTMLPQPSACRLCSVRHTQT